MNARCLWSCLASVVIAFASGCGAGSSLGDASGTHDAAHDGTSNLDARDVSTPSDGSMETGTVCGCGPTEICGDGFDNNCDGRVDENCPCLPGTTQRCLNGTPQPGAPLCAFGQQQCNGTGEFGTWGDCTGAGSMSDASSTAIACRRIVVLGAPGANPSANFQAWLESNGAIVTRTQTTATDGPLRRELLDTFDVAIIDWLQRDYTVDESNILRDWILAGGGLISLSGHDSGATADRQVSLLQSVGITYQLGTAYNGPATFVASPISMIPGSTRILGPVTFEGGLQVITTPAFMGTSMAVAMVPPGVVVGIIGDFATAGNPHAGRAFVFGDEWIEFDSEWSTMPDIPQLWFNTLNWVNPTVVGSPTGCE